MTNSLCKSSVLKTYQEVISDVITHIREQFIEDGVDETVIQELKSLWETKLAATKAATQLSQETADVEKNIGASSNAAKLQQQQQQQNYISQIHQQQSRQKQIKQTNTQLPQAIAFPEWRRVPVQLTIPSAPGSNEDSRILAIEVPEVFLQGILKWRSDKK
ncbi:transcription initiation factor IIA subunit 1-like isoform X2 [Cylas formicarius]|uniref:transcription initiation factor IIA subunit 1-like isoform X2 n=1 Tax=Cylas formicarius TaxID=197179 RepID=UPI0029584273|nr:transcription initiation factor IIA subunit 1-like isoform X2 [Cylas formicarius]